MNRGGDNYGSNNYFENYDGTFFQSNDVDNTDQFADERNYNYQDVNYNVGENLRGEVYYSYSSNKNSYSSDPYGGTGHEDGSEYARQGYYSGDNEACAHQSQHQGEYGSYAYSSQENYGYGAAVDPSSSSSSSVTSLFYPSQAPFVIHTNGEPDDYGNYDTQGDPISALALDGNYTHPSTLYVASHTSLQGERTVHPRASFGRRNILHSDNPTLTRGSRMTVLFDDENARANHVFGGRNVYSSFTAHPEAEGKVLECLHGMLFGGDFFANVRSLSEGSVGRSGGNPQHHPYARPSHAYGPPFGLPASTVNSVRSVGVMAANGSHILHPQLQRLPSHPHPHGHSPRPEDRHCMGITSILPFVSPYFGSGGRVCTVSPHGVRIHTRGGVLMAEKQQQLRGMVCGVLGGVGGGGTSEAGAGGPTNSNFATVGGISLSFNDNSSELVNSSLSSMRRPHHVHCIDLHRDLKIVSSHSFLRDTGSSNGTHIGARDTGTSGSGSLCVTDMVANLQRSNLVVGCSDGTIRLLDGGRRQAEVAKAKAHSGGVAQVAVCENLICATGYATSGTSSAASPLPYPFPAQHVLVYDIRYLGRGGFPHVFSANRGGPRFVAFLPENCSFETGVSGLDDGGQRLLVGSGQTFGGFEVIRPFQSEEAAGGSNFFQPALNAGESITTMSLHDGELLIGSSYGRVLQYGLTNYQKTMHTPRQRNSSSGGGTTTKSLGAIASPLLSTSLSVESPGRSHSAKESLDIPPFVPPPPDVSVDPTILFSSSSQPNSRSLRGPGNKSSAAAVFDHYILASDPILSIEQSQFHSRYGGCGKVESTTFGPLEGKTMLIPPRRWLSKTLIAALEESTRGGNSNGIGGKSGTSTGADFIKVLPTSRLCLNNLLKMDASLPSQMSFDNMPDNRNGTTSDKSMGKEVINFFSNPNKLLYSASSFRACYDAIADPRKKVRDCRSEDVSGREDLTANEDTGIPSRYRLTIRPPFYKVADFDYSRYNDTGLWVGWDYAPTLSNSFVCSILALLYFVPELRAIALRFQLCNKEMSIQPVKMAGHETNISIVAELGLLFHLIKNLSANGMIYPEIENKHSDVGQVKAFVPSNIISAFSLLPEATNLALLDGVAGCTEIAKRPEAFYRFLLHYLDRELEQLLSNSSTQLTSLKQTCPNGHLIDSLQGMTFLCIIEYINGVGKPKMSTSRALTVDLVYDQKVAQNDKVTNFGDILCCSLCREIPLRAWCDESSSYQSVVQRKIVASLPSLLSLSCCCAGKSGEKGLQLWQQDDVQNWLPEFIEIEIETDRSVIVKELSSRKDGNEEWIVSKQKPLLPASFSESLNDVVSSNDCLLPIKKAYRLEIVVSFIRDNTNDDSHLDRNEGHHVVHVRSPLDLEIDALSRQLHSIESCLEDAKDISANEDNLREKSRSELTLTSKIPPAVLQERHLNTLERLKKKREKINNEGKKDNEWLLFNGFVVSRTISDDVRSFNGRFKEPSIVVFRETSGVDQNAVSPITETELKDLEQNITVSTTVMETTSISNGRVPNHSIPSQSEMPGKADLIAIDTEFVCVQAEESMITPSGSKEIISESRNSLARLSMIDCRTNKVIVDDYVLQRDKITDYLTRFSGIREKDLDPKISPHHLVTIQDAYLKVRLFVERGCMFVGHGLSQDFRALNICVPPNQIIDTAEIFRQPNQRYISLRFLTNYVLGRDMQQEIHDSIEDARAAHELHTKAVRLKKEGNFDRFVRDLYVFGHKTQFKLGVVGGQK